MSTPEHLAGYSAIEAAFRAATGRELVSFVVVGVDARGEVYTGAKAAPGSDHTALIRVTKQRLDFITTQQSKEPA